MSTRRLPLPVALLLALVVAAPAVADFVTFESGQVRPLALSPDGSRLFAVNTPDNRLEIFDVTAGGLTHRAARSRSASSRWRWRSRSASEVWVVNHLSDSVSIVDVAADPPRVVRTLLVGDEPRDIVFAGPGGNRAFITTAHRGQQRTDPSLAGVPGAGDPQLTTPGVGRADVWVFDANALGAALGGMPLRIVTLFGDTPRALAVSPDGGDRLRGDLQVRQPDDGPLRGRGVQRLRPPPPPCVVDGVTMPGGLPRPGTDHAGRPRAGDRADRASTTPRPAQWEDQLGRDWSRRGPVQPARRGRLRDRRHHARADGASFTGVGTTLFNMAVNPVSGTVYVSNTESRNEVRFEGPGVFGGSTVQGHLAESRITVLSAGAASRRAT